MKTTIFRLSSTLLFATAYLAFAQANAAGDSHQHHDVLPIADAHLHYSHDSVEMTPPERVIEIMREANLKLALVSSSDDKGTQLLTELAPDLIVPGLRPYRKRGETGTWFTDEAALDYVEKLLAKNSYATIGEFHLYGENAELPIPKRIVELAVEHNLILHAHSDADAVERLLAQDPNVKVLWAHSGFDSPEEIATMLGKHDRLWADLAFRSEVGSGGKLDKEWTKLFTDFPDRMMLGTDSYTPERMFYIPSHAESAREWLASLPKDVAENVAWKNAHNLLMPVWNENRKKAEMMAMNKHGDSKHGKMDHGEMEHGDTKHGKMDHGEMKHGDTKHGKMDHGEMKHGDTKHGKMDHGEMKHTNIDIADVCGSTPDDDDVVLQQGDSTIWLHTAGDIKVSQPLSVLMTRCGGNNEHAELTLDAFMPAHGHGMNYQPNITEVARNGDAVQYRVEGVVLHMPGNWQWQVDVKSDAGNDTLQHDFSVE